MTRGMLGKHHSQETKEKMRAKALGRKFTKEHIENLRKSHSGSRHVNFGKHLSEVTRAKISKGNSGIRNHSFGQNHSGEKAPCWKGDKATQNAGRIRARKLFKCPKGKEIHHIDGNDLNNTPENILFLTRKEHMLLDGRLDKFMVIEK